MRIIQAALTALVLQASQTIANLTRLHDGSHKAPVCISCDVLLDLQTFTKIPIQTLKKSIRRLECTYPLPAEVKEQYKRPPTESFRWLENALLSPNWAYVVLSRSTTLNGIFLREELDSSKNFSADLRLLDHLACLRRTIRISNVF